METVARALRAAGRTRAQIAAELGVSLSTVHGLVQGEPVRHPGLRARAKDDLRERARALRAEGSTYDEIAQALGVAKSSVSLWVRDVPCGPRKHDPDRVARMREARWGNVLRERECERARTKEAARAEIGRLTDRELLLVGVALYWSEGAKDKPWARREMLTFINSDADMIRLYLRWLRLHDVPTGSVRLKVALHETGDLEAAHAYWSDVTGLDRDHFNKATVKRHNPVTRRKNVGDDYRGCLTVTARGGAELYRRVEGWWSGMVAGSVALPQRGG